MINCTHRTRLCGALFDRAPVNIAVHDFAEDSNTARAYREALTARDAGGDDHANPE